MIITIDDESIKATANRIAPKWLTNLSTRIAWIVQMAGRQRDETYVRMILADAASKVTTDPAERQAFVEAAYTTLVNHQVLPGAVELTTEPVSESTTDSG